MWLEFCPEKAYPYNVIHPLQHKYVDKILNLDLNPGILSIILFGGSIKTYCSEFSDLDLYVIVKEDDVEIIDTVREELYLQLKTIGKKCDLIVVSLAEFNLWRDDFDTVDWYVQREGVELWHA